MIDLISQMEKWYSARCVLGDGNHHGFRIENVAEGGWFIRVDMPASELSQLQSVLQPLERPIKDYPETWIHCSISDGAFIGGCGPCHLRGLLSTFLTAVSHIEPDVVDSQR